MEQVFVIYVLTDSAFSGYLYEQMDKHGFSYDKNNFDRMPCGVKVGESEFIAVIPAYETELADEENEYWYQGVYLSRHRKNDYEMMSEKFLEVLGEIMPLEKVDDPEKLYDAFVSDLENGRFKCELTEDVNFNGLFGEEE